MMRADVFALLSISMNKSFFNDIEQINIIKTACLKFIEGEGNERIKNTEVFKYL